MPRRRMPATISSLSSFIIPGASGSPPVSIVSFAFAFSFAFSFTPVLAASGFFAGALAAPAD